MPNSLPKVSIFTTCKNAEAYLEETLDSILAQTFQDYEVVIVDGVSTDRSLEIIKKYAGADSRIRWISEPDKDALEGFYKSLLMTQGEYVMCLPISDYYLSKTWLEKCVRRLDEDIELSMVHGCPVNVEEDGTLVNVPFIDQVITPLPSKEDFTARYFATCCFVSELTYCVRRSVYLTCFPRVRQSDNFNFGMENTSVLTDEVLDPYLWFLLEFFAQGYFAAYLPVFATAGRVHVGSRSIKFKQYLELAAAKYTADVVGYRNRLLTGKAKIIFKDGNSKPLKTLESKDLKIFKQRVLKYRITEKQAFGRRETTSILILGRLVGALKLLVPRSLLFGRWFSK